MDIDRHQGRILAMQTLCQLEVQGDAYLAEAPSFIAEARVSGPTASYAYRLAATAWRNRASLDAELAASLAEWRVERLVSVDRNVLRVALVELEEKDVPPLVVLNEAIEIGREYGTADSARFVNGVLDAAWKARQGEART